MTAVASYPFTAALVNRLATSQFQYWRIDPLLVELFWTFLDPDLLVLF